MKRLRLLPAVAALAVAWIPVSAPASGECTVLVDAAGDVGTTLWIERADEQVDLRSVSFDATEDALTVRMTVSSLSASLGEGVQSQYWTTSWTVGERMYSVSADRSSGAPPAFTFVKDGAWDTARGAIDVSSLTVSVVVPRTAFPDNVALTDIVASAGSASTPILWGQYDGAPDTGSPGRFTPGVPCGVEVQVCPPVADAAGDAGTIVHTSMGDVPRNEESLDVRSLGGVPASADVVRVGVRVADAAASLPDGWDVAGWTVSWMRSDEERYFAQAVRTPSGVRFTYGVDGSSSLSGPVFGGRRTSGVIEDDVISVDVPLSAIGNPSSLRGLGATTWMMRSGNTAAPYRSIDATEVGSYAVGTVCAP